MFAFAKKLRSRAIVSCVPFHSSTMKVVMNRRIGSCINANQDCWKVANFGCKMEKYKNMQGAALPAIPSLYLSIECQREIRVRAFLWDHCELNMKVWECDIRYPTGQVLKALVTSKIWMTTVHVHSRICDDRLQALSSSSAIWIFRETLEPVLSMTSRAQTKSSARWKRKISNCGLGYGQYYKRNWTQRL